MGKWVGAFIANDDTEFTPDKADGEWQVGNEIVHQNALAEFVDALRERGYMAPPPGILSRQAFKEIRAQLKTDLGILAVFIGNNLDLSEPPDVTAAIERYHDLDDEDEEDMREPVVPGITSDA